MSNTRYLVISEGTAPANAEPVFATGDERLVRAALSAIFGELKPTALRALPRSARTPRPIRSEHAAANSIPK